MSHETTLLYFREVGKKVGSQFSITNIQVGKEGRGIPYCRHMCACRYISVCMYIWLCGHIPHFFYWTIFFSFCDSLSHELPIRFSGCVNKETPYSKLLNFFGI